MDAARTGTKVMGGVACCLAGLATCAGGAAAVPRIDAVNLDGAAAGRPVELRIQATDPQAPVTGLVVGFGRGEDGFGLSSCLPGAPAARRATLAAPHVFATPGTRQVTARVTSSGCTGGQPSLLQRLTVPVAPRGRTPQPIVIQPPAILPLGQVAPHLPGLGQLPLARSEQVSPLALPAAPCRNASRRFRRTAAGERSARRALLCLMNRERAARGLRRVGGNTRLTRAAVRHSRAMVSLRFFAHVGPGSLQLADRLRRSRYLPRRGGRWLVGENIGFGRNRMTRPSRMHLAWMRSSPHRAAILEPRFREVGFGIVSGRPYGRGGATFTANFGRRGR